MTDARVRGELEVTWSEPEPFVAVPNARRGETAYPFAQMQVGGQVLCCRGRSIYTVRSAIRRFCRAQKARDSKFKRRYVARLARDDKGELVKVWRLA